jgi:hypothetical protein
MLGKLPALSPPSDRDEDWAEGRAHAGKALYHLSLAPGAFGFFVLFLRQALPTFARASLKLTILLPQPLE